MSTLFTEDRSDSEGVTKKIYELYLYDEDLKTEFTEEEKYWLRPIAETLAMLDGNAFFGMDPGNTGKDWYEMYLTEAWALWKSNGGIEGWAGDVGWIQMKAQRNPAVKAAYEQFQIMLQLAKDKK